MKKRSLIFLDDTWAIGGGAIFNIRLGGLLKSFFEYENVKGLNQKVECDIKKALTTVPYEILCQDHKSSFRRKRISHSVHKINILKPEVLIFSVLPELCEIARHASPKIVKIGVIHLIDEESFAWARIYQEYMDAVVCVSHLGLERVQSIDQDLARKSFFIPPGINIPSDNFVRLFNNTAPLRLLYLGRLEEQSKRVRSIPRIAELLQSQGVLVEWTLAGTGKEEAYLKNEIHRLDLKRVNMVGVVSQDQLPTLFSNHDVIVSTSDSESYSLSLHEGMAWGLVPVAGRVPGAVEQIVSLGGGYLVDPNEPQEFADAIRTLNSRRDILKIKSTASMDTRKSQSSWLRVAEQWASLIESLGSQKRSVSCGLSKSINPPLLLHKRSSINYFFMGVGYNTLNILDRHLPSFSDFIQDFLGELIYAGRGFLKKRL